MLKTTFKYLKNKYILTSLVLLVWLIFFDANDFITQFKYKRKLNDLQEEKAFYKKEIKETKQSLYELTTNPHTLEKFAREQYLMKKENEDVFIIVREKEND